LLQVVVVELRVELEELQVVVVAQVVIEPALLL
jgi:hypothetical protein